MDASSSARTPLHLAASAEEVLLLLSSKTCRVDVDARCFDGQTPLHIACERGAVDITRLLIEHGADVCAVDYAGWSGLSRACLHGHLEVVRLLLASGGAALAVDEYGQCAMHKALVKDRRDAALLLLEHSGDGALLRVKDIHGKRPLEYARMAGYEETVCVLRRHARWLQRRGLLLLARSIERGRDVADEGPSPGSLLIVLTQMTRYIASYL